jgi:hypothetical protein
LFFFLLPIVLSVLFRLTASDYPFTKFRLFYSITINLTFPLYKLFKLDANIIIISFNVFLISLYYKNKANTKIPLPTCDKWHKGKQNIKCHYIHHTRDTWHQVCFSSITARHLQVYIMNTADVLHETVKAYPSRAPVVIVAPLFFSHIFILTFIPLLQTCSCLSYLKVRKWLLLKAKWSMFQLYHGGKCIMAGKCFSYIVAGKSYFSMRRWCCPLCTKQTRLVGFL